MSSLTLFQTKSYKPYYLQPFGTPVAVLKVNVKDQTKMSAQYFGTSDYIDGGTSKYHTGKYSC